MMLRLLVLTLLLTAPFSVQATVEPKHILIVTTSHSELSGTGRKTGLWLEEFTAPYYIFKDAGISVTVASVRGGRVPVDPQSDTGEEASVRRFKKDADAQKLLVESVPLSRVNAQEFDAVFLPGGHGAAWDFADNGELKAVIEAVLKRGGALGAVCHGPVGLYNLRSPEGAPLVKGRKVTGFSNAEEESVGLMQVVPVPLESKLKDMGALYFSGPAFKPYAVRDGTLVTGQNPASSEKTALLLMDVLMGK